MFAVGILAWVVAALFAASGHEPIRSVAPPRSAGAVLASYSVSEGCGFTTPGVGTVYAAVYGGAGYGNSNNGTGGAGAEVDSTFSV